MVDKSLLVCILKGLDHIPLYNAINHDVSIFAQENRTVHTVAVSTLACPSDLDSGFARPLSIDLLAKSRLAEPDEHLEMVYASYSGVYGSCFVEAIPTPAGQCLVPGPLAAQANGSFTDIAPIRVASILDGLSNTLFVVEKSTTLFRQIDRSDSSLFESYGWYVSSNWGDTLATTFYPPNMPLKVAAAARAAHTRAAASQHVGGLNCLMGDGSARFIKDTIQTWPCDRMTGVPVGAVMKPQGWWEHLPPPGVWQSLATRAGGEIVDPSAF